MARITLNISDEKHAVLEAVAKSQNSSISHFLESNFNKLLRLNSEQNQILLEGPHVAALSDAVGGKTLSKPEDVVKLMLDVFRLSVNGINVTLDLEDINGLNDTHSSFPHIPFADYVALNVKEGLAQYLWGSTRGLLV